MLRTLSKEGKVEVILSAWYSRDSKYCTRSLNPPLLSFFKPPFRIPPPSLLIFQHKAHMHVLLVLFLVYILAEDPVISSLRPLPRFTPSNHIKSIPSCVDSIPRKQQRDKPSFSYLPSPVLFPLLIHLYCCCVKWWRYVHGIVFHCLVV